MHVASFFYFLTVRLQFTCPGTKIYRHQLILHESILQNSVIAGGEPTPERDVYSKLLSHSPPRGNVYFFPWKRVAAARIRPLSS